MPPAACGMFVGDGGGKPVWGGSRGACPSQGRGADPFLSAGSAEDSGDRQQAINFIRGGREPRSDTCLGARFQPGLCQLPQGPGARWLTASPAPEVLRGEARALGLGWLEWPGVPDGRPVTA